MQTQRFKRVWELFPLFQCEINGSKCGIGKDCPVIKSHTPFASFPPLFLFPAKIISMIKNVNTSSRHIILISSIDEQSTHTLYTIYISTFRHTSCRLEGNQKTKVFFPVLPLIEGGPGRINKNTIFLNFLSLL